MANHGAIDVAMRWQLTVREPFRLVRTVRLHFNRQGHVVGHSVGFHRPVLHGPAGLDEIAEVLKRQLCASTLCASAGEASASAAKIAAAFIGPHLTWAARPVFPRMWPPAEGEALKGRP